MKYIPAEKLIAEVKRLQPRLRRIGGKDVLVTTDSVYKKLNRIIDFARSSGQEWSESTLIDSEIFEWIKEHGSEDTAQVIAMTARHFYGLGKARKE